MYFSFVLPHLQHSNLICFIELMVIDAHATHHCRSCCCACLWYRAMASGEGAQHQQHMHNKEIRHDAQPAQRVDLQAASKGHQ